MSSFALSGEKLLEAVRAAEERKESALAEYQSAAAEITWLREGLRLRGISPPPSAKLNDQVIAELMYLDGTKPTLRQAIVWAMLTQPTASWRVAELAAEIVKEGWLDESEDAAKRVSDMAGVMVDAGLVVRLDRGTYGLAPEFAARYELLRRNPFLAGTKLGPPEIT